MDGESALLGSKPSSLSLSFAAVDEVLSCSSLFLGLLYDLARLGGVAGVAGVGGRLLLSVIEMTGIGSSRFAMTSASSSAMMTTEAEQLWSLVAIISVKLLHVVCVDPARDCGLS